MTVDVLQKFSIVHSTPASTIQTCKGDLFRFSESFPDPGALLQECARCGLEGTVCKRKDAPYRSGPRSGWVKVKTAEWRAANQYRAKLFERGWGALWAL